MLQPLKIIKNIMRKLRKKENNKYKKNIRIIRNNCKRKWKKIKNYINTLLIKSGKMILLNFKLQMKTFIKQL